MCRPSLTTVRFTAAGYCHLLSVRQVVLSSLGNFYDSMIFIVAKVLANLKSQVKLDGRRVFQWHSHSFATALPVMLKLTVNSEKNLHFTYILSIHCPDTSFIFTESSYDLHLGELRLSSFTQLSPKAMSQKSGGEVGPPLSATRTSGTILASPSFTPTAI